MSACTCAGDAVEKYLCAKHGWIEVPLAGYEQLERIATRIAAIPTWSASRYLEGVILDARAYCETSGRAIEEPERTK